METHIKLLIVGAVMGGPAVLFITFGWMYGFLNAMAGTHFPETMILAFYIVGICFIVAAAVLLLTALIKYNQQKY